MILCILMYNPIERVNIPVDSLENTGSMTEPDISDLLMNPNTEEDLWDVGKDAHLALVFI